LTLADSQAIDQCLCKYGHRQTCTADPCPAQGTPIVVAALHGSSHHADARGGNAMYSVNKNGFRVYVHSTAACDHADLSKCQGKGITPGMLLVEWAFQSLIERIQQSLLILVAAQGLDNIMTGYSCVWRWDDASTWCIYMYVDLTKRGMQCCTISPCRRMEMDDQLPRLRRPKTFGNSFSHLSYGML
jgi:hypothetical protein